MNNHNLEATLQQQRLAQNFNDAKDKKDATKYLASNDMLQRVLRRASEAMPFDADLPVLTEEVAERIRNVIKEERVAEVTRVIERVNESIVRW